jgi:hypothetical protein
MPKQVNSKQQHMRERIAQLAARLMAEDGIRDFALAKRKAARQMGAPDTKSLPTNGEIEHALRVHQALYQKDEQTERLRALRLQALKAMALLEQFNPCLTGAVVNGTAVRHAGISLHVFVDSLKEVELFLLNRGVPYRTSEQRFRFGDAYRMVPVLMLEGDPAEIELAVFDTDDLRQTPRDPVDGRPMERLKARQVEALLGPE